jgi:hypothetical protein
MGQFNVTFILLGCILIVQQGQLNARKMPFGIIHLLGKILEKIEFDKGF